MGMEQVGLLPAILAGTFLVVALFNAVIPRRGDWLVILAMLAVLVIGFLVIKDFQTYFHDGEFMPNGENAYSFEWVNIGDGTFAIDFTTWVDSITVVMITVVSIVALMVMVTTFVAPPMLQLLAKPKRPQRSDSEGIEDLVAGPRDEEEPS